MRRTFKWHRLLSILSEWCVHVPGTHLWWSTLPSWRASLLQAPVLLSKKEKTHSVFNLRCGTSSEWGKVCKSPSSDSNRNNLGLFGKDDLLWLWQELQFQSILSAHCTWADYFLIQRCHFFWAFTHDIWGTILSIFDHNGRFRMSETLVVCQDFCSPSSGVV